MGLEPTTSGAISGALPLSYTTGQMRGSCGTGPAFDTRKAHYGTERAGRAYGARAAEAEPRRT